MFFTLAESLQHWTSLNSSKIHTPNTCYLSALHSEDFLPHSNKTPPSKASLFRSVTSYSLEFQKITLLNHCA